MSLTVGKIYIDGTDITPYIKYQGVKWSRNDVDGVNTGRTLSGKMVRDRVATKIRLDITCRPITSDQLRILLNLITPEFVSVTYDDPQDGVVTRTMYSNNNSAEFLLARRSGTEYWHNISFPLIEQ